MKTWWTSMIERHTTVGRAGQNGVVREEDGHGKRGEGGKTEKRISRNRHKRLLVLVYLSQQRGRMRAYSRDVNALALTSICRSPFLRSPSAPLSQGQRGLPDIRFNRFLAFIPPPPYPLPLRPD